MDERTALESEIIRKCLSRSEMQCSFFEYRGFKVIYRRYASLFFIIGTKPDLGNTENTENELGMLELIHTLVETMDKWAGYVLSSVFALSNSLRHHRFHSPIDQFGKFSFSSNLPSLTFARRK